MINLCYARNASLARASFLSVADSLDRQMRDIDLPAVLCVTLLMMGNEDAAVRAAAVRLFRCVSGRLLADNTGGAPIATTGTARAGITSVRDSISRRLSKDCPRIRLAFIDEALARLENGVGKATADMFGGGMQGSSASSSAAAGTAASGSTATSAGTSGAAAGSTAATSTAAAATSGASPASASPMATCTWRPPPVWHKLERVKSSSRPRWRTTDTFPSKSHMAVPCHRLRSSTQEEMFGLSEMTSSGSDQRNGSVLAGAVIRRMPPAGAPGAGVWPMPP